ncbi:MAG: hypothetical protein VXY77_01470 [Pseudomonadota bacterium]|nr:hypothetical protein [Pseudomonadota bacterium]
MKSALTLSSVLILLSNTMTAAAVMDKDYMIGVGTDGIFASGNALPGLANHYFYFPHLAIKSKDHSWKITTDISYVTTGKERASVDISNVEVSREPTEPSIPIGFDIKGKGLLFEASAEYFFPLVENIKWGIGVSAGLRRLSFSAKLDSETQTKVSNLASSDNADFVTEASILTAALRELAGPLSAVNPGHEVFDFDSAAITIGINYPISQALHLYVKSNLIGIANVRDKTSETLYGQVSTEQGNVVNYSATAKVGGKALLTRVNGTPRFGLAVYFM